ncbi:MAG: FAD-dependent thymidylate synthase [Candidatus Marinimicrobia bacterium]|nr:FAD-dependent thymidylate synthase [Candidatus Neomarinimicrobiota bacterium]MDD5539087.1 FAD-dependent thymidylate synthase [Candidatus Neomarinimicrobiota bacterium]
MEIIKPSVIIETPIDANKIMMNLERCGRIAYKSRDKITPESAAKFIADDLKSGHESVIEHEILTVRFICDRSVTIEPVRYPLCAFTQESTRYGKVGVNFIMPPWGLDPDDIEYLRTVEAYYNKKLAMGQTPQQARYFLPNGLKTEIVVTANLHEWRRIIRLRAEVHDHPQMQQLMNILKKELQEKLPVIFGDL